MWHCKFYASKGKNNSIKLHIFWCIFPPESLINLLLNYIIWRICWLGLDLISRYVWRAAQPESSWWNVPPWWWNMTFLLLSSMPAFAYRIPVSSLPVVRGKYFFFPPACHHWPPVLCSSLLLQPVRTDSLCHFSSNKDSFFWWLISLKEVLYLNCLVEVHICPSEVSPDELCSRIWPLTSSSCILSDICPVLSMFLGVAETLVYVLFTSFKRQSLIKKKTCFWCS